MPRSAQPPERSTRHLRPASMSSRWMRLSFGWPRSRTAIPASAREGQFWRWLPNRIPASYVVEILVVLVGLSRESKTPLAEWTASATSSTKFSHGRCSTGGGVGSSFFGPPFKQQPPVEKPTAHVPLREGLLEPCPSAGRERQRNGFRTRIGLFLVFTSNVRGELNSSVIFGIRFATARWRLW